jgi:hypothetical protein
MDDKVMYAWQVVGYNEYVHFTCARKETAEYLRDWLQAIEENNWRDSAKSCNLTYEPNGHHQLFQFKNVR